MRAIYRDTLTSDGDGSSKNSIYLRSDVHTGYGDTRRNTSFSRQ